MDSSRFFRPDLHLHSSFSDGTDTPGMLLQKLRETDTDVFSLTDHDSAAGCREIAALLTPDDPVFIPGVEFSCEDEGGKYHILGYAFAPEASSVRALIQHAHDIRLQKAVSRFSFLEKRWGLSFSEAEKDALLRGSNPGKPHFVALMLQKGMISRKEEGYALFLGEDPVAYISPEAAFTAILDAGGIPVLAHGILADGSAPLSKEEITCRLLRLKEAGLMGAECFYSAYTDSQRAVMLSLAEKYGLLITAGSDYHGENKRVALGQTGLDEPSLLFPFYEAALMRRRGDTI